MGALRKTFLDPETGRWVRVCCECGEMKDLEREFHRARKELTGRVTDWGYQCKPCKAAQVKRMKDQRKKDPMIARRDRVNHARWMREWRQRNPTRAKAIRRRYMEGVRRDPERRARMLENARINYRLRAEREGRTVRAIKASKGSDSLPRLPVGPLVEFLDRLGDGIGADELGVRLGFDARQLRGWRNEYEYVNWDVADRILTNAGVMWWEVWTEEDYPELYARLAA